MSDTSEHGGLKIEVRYDCVLKNWFQPNWFQRFDSTAAVIGYKVVVKNIVKEPTHSGSHNYYGTCVEIL